MSWRDLDDGDYIEDDYLPVGTAVTWGTRDYAYVVQMVKVERGRVIHVMDVFHIHDHSFYKQREVTNDDLDSWLGRDATNVAFSNDGLEGLLEAIEEEDLS